MSIINCTPHEIKVRRPCLGGQDDGHHAEICGCPDHASGTEISIPASGIVPRVSTIETPADDVHEFPCVTTSAGEVTGLPEPAAQCRSCKCPVAFGSGPDCECGGEIEDIFLLVSRMVFDATNRPDVICPDTGPTCVRNDKGHIIAVTRLIRK